ncbi:MAG: hypothetical protein IJW59_05660 [Clostridia bacterium]|nr:hypothetical protein [Clostridia bacterium]
MSKKYLRKNEFRFDINPEHFGKEKRPHPTYITARYGRKFRANSITHSRTVNGFKNLDIFENPNLKSNDKRHTRISPPFWQSDKLFSKETLPNFRFSKQARRKISKYNRKFK